MNSTGHFASTRRRALPTLVAVLAAAAFSAVVFGGCGDDEPTVPTGAVAVIEHAPPGRGEITKAELEHQIEINDVGYENLGGLAGGSEDELAKDAAMQELIKRRWIEGAAEELGLTVSDREMADELAVDARLGGSSPYTKADSEEVIRENVLTEKTDAWLREHAPQPTQEEVEAAYREYKKSYRPVPDVVTYRFIINKSRSKALQARRQLERGTYNAWERVTERFSEDAETKHVEGLRDAREEELEEPLREAVFSAPSEKVTGPIKTSHGFVVFEVNGRSQDPGLQSLASMRDEIESNLRSEAEGPRRSEYLNEYTDRWRERTYCAPKFMVSACANSPTAEE
jgi:foldase protein PrsA